MTFERTERFKRAAKRLGARDRERLYRALGRFASDPSHPALRVKRIQGTERFWEARVSDAIRFTFERIEGGNLLRNVGPHDPTLKSP